MNRPPAGGRLTCLVYSNFLVGRSRPIVPILFLISLSSLLPVHPLSSGTPPALVRTQRSNARGDPIHPIDSGEKRETGERTMIASNSDRDETATMVPFPAPVT